MSAPPGVTGLAPDDWQLLRQHFEALCDLPAPAQQTALTRLDIPETLRLRLAAMLGGDQSNGLTRSLQRPLRQLASEVGQLCRSGQRIGAYRLLSPLGRGGMGTVWLAERADGLYEGRVAIKFVGHGDFQQQFELERRLLARLDHRGIARLLDAGADDDDTPYVVMELVEGETLDQHVRGRGLGPFECINLIRQCAVAVAHAHERLILHRDLKPDNVLVDANGIVRVLDFGIADLMDASAGPAVDGCASFYTPRYAAPEQIAGEPAGTAADIYSLAVILFELLCNVHPTLGQEGAGIGDREPMPAGETRRLRSVLSTLAPLTRAQLRDLDRVLVRALATNPAARCASAEQFASDLGRIVDNRPLSWGTTSRAEQVWRWSRRQPLAAGLMVGGLLAVVVGGGLALWQAGIARNERDQALHQSARAERIADFMTGLFSAARPTRSKGDPVLATDLLAAGRERLSSELQDDPLLRASLLGTVGDTYRSLGEQDAARELLDQALEQLPAGAEAIRERQRLLWLRGKIELFDARYEASLPWLTRAAMEARTGGNRRVAAGSGLHRAVALINLDRLPEAEAAARQALDDIGNDPAAVEQSRIGGHSLLGTISLMRGDTLAALRSATEVLRQREALHGAEHHALSTDYNNIAAIELRLGRLQDAERNYRKAIGLARDHLGDMHVTVALPLSGLAMVQRAQGNIGSSVATLSESIRIHDGWAGPDSAGGAYVRYLQAELLWLSGEPVAARTALGRAATHLSESHGEHHDNSCRSQVVANVVDDRSDIEVRRERLHAARACLQDLDAGDAALLVADLALLQLDPLAASDPAAIEPLRSRAEALHPANPVLVAALQQR